MQEISKKISSDILLANYHYRRKWSRITKFLSVFVIILTLSALTLPAITMNIAKCGMEEHQHTVDCYAPGTTKELTCTLSTLNIHEHEDTCYDEAGVLICALIDFVIHSHDENCFDDKGDLICTLGESEGTEHIHNDSCYLEGELICQTKEILAHQHTEDCFTVKENILTCLIPEHTHNDECKKFIKLTEEEQLQVDEVIFSINALPEYQKVSADLTNFHNSADIEGREAYIRELNYQTGIAASQYDALSEEQKNAVTNYEKLSALQTLLPENETIKFTAEELKQLEIIRSTFSELPDAELLSTQLSVLKEEGKTEEYTNTLSDASKQVENARKLYDGLSDTLKLFVTQTQKLISLETLIKAESETTLTEEEKAEVKALNETVDALPAPQTVEDSLSQESSETSVDIAALYLKVEKACADYDAMTESQKSEVKNLQKLTELSALLITLTLTEEEQKQVDDVIFIINALPDIEEIEENFKRYENDEAALKAYEEKTYSAIRLAFDSYDTLNERQRLNVTNAKELENYRNLSFGEDTLTASLGGYSLKASFSADAKIPADAELNFQPIKNGTKSSNSYLTLAKSEMPDSIVRDGRFFDISIVSDGEKITPAAPIELTLTFDEPMKIEYKEYCRIIHFGHSETEFPEGIIHREGDYITGVTFFQDSFSVSGITVAAAAIDNAADNGPDSITCNYYVYINNVWEKVGTTTTGWYLQYPDTAVGGTAANPFTRSYITVEQAYSVLGKYGFSMNYSDAARKIGYQDANNGLNSTIWNDTYGATFNGTNIIPLSKPTNYNLYFLPNNTAYVNSVSNQSGLTTAKCGEFRFYSLDIYDTQNIVYTDKECAALRTVWSINSTATVTLKSGSFKAWRQTNASGKTIKDHLCSSDSTTTITISGITEHTKLMPNNTNDFGPDKFKTNLYVFIDGSWQKVGETNHGWRRSNYSTDDWDNMDTRDMISVNQIKEHLSYFGFSFDYLSALDFAYKRVGSSDSTYYRNTTYVTRHGHGMIPLSRLGTGEEYNVYYLPGGTWTGSWTGDSIPYNINGMDVRFWSVRVKDDQNWIYTDEELAAINNKPTGASDIFRHGSVGSVTVKCKGYPWMWRELTNNAYYRRGSQFVWTNNSDGTITVSTDVAMDRALYLDAGDKSQHSTGSTGALSGDKKVISGSGITFKLFDYRADINEMLGNQGLLTGPKIYSDYNGMLNSTNYFAFRDDYTPWGFYTQSSKYDRDGFWLYDSNKGPDHATVKLNLNGTPELDLTHHGNIAAPAGNINTSLAGLFTENEYTKQYNCINTPLQFAEEDFTTTVTDGDIVTYKAGYYYYDSRLNAADYNTETNTWYIRNYTERNHTTASSYPKYWDFLPFNNGSGSFIGAVNDASYQYTVEEIDYWFGMTMTVNFIQGKDGMVEYKGEVNPMKFHFSGDDDVYLFVDNMLVLDIGGTHGAVDGWVDFSSGLVELKYNFNMAPGESQWNNPAHCTSSTLYECYKAAFKEQGMSDNEITNRLNEIFVKAEGETVTDDFGKSYPVYRFKNYSSHTMNFFYKERGSAASNCSLSFNLPTLPDETLIVGKEIEFQDGEITQEEKDFAMDHIEYRFRVIDADGNPIFKDSDVTVFDESLEETLGLTHIDSEGWFTLRAGQRVKFEHMLKTFQELDLPGLTYYVQEAIPADVIGQYKNVAYMDGGSSGQVTIEGESGTEWILYKTGVLSPENTYTVVYTNRVNVQKMSGLRISKEVLKGSVWNGTDTFRVMITIGDKILTGGTAFIDVDTGETVNVAPDGYLTIKAGQTLELFSPVISGSEFFIEEEAKDGWVISGYTYSYSGKTDRESNPKGIRGIIPADETVLVTVKNTTFSFSADIPVSKNFFSSDKEDIERTATFHAEQVKDLSGTPLDADVTPIPSEISDITITCNGEETGTNNFVIGYNSTTADGTYYYKITEAQFNAPFENFIKDSSVYIAEIEVINQTATLKAIYKNATPLTEKTAVFENRIATTVLPNTGGIGVTLFYLFGGLLILIAVVLLITKRKTDSEED